MITIKFYQYCRNDMLTTVKLDTYKEFFEFFLKNSEKGCIYKVKDDGKTK